MSTPPANDPNRRRPYRSLRLLWPFVKPHRMLALGWLVFLGISSGATLVLPTAVRHMIDHGFRNSSTAAINASFLGLFAVALVMAYVDPPRAFTASACWERTLAALRAKLYAHVIRLDCGLFRTQPRGRIDLSPRYRHRGGTSAGRFGHLRGIA